MALSPAERQKKFRQKNDYRINTVVSTEAAIGLQLLCSCYVVTKKAMIEKLIVDAKATMIESMSEKEIDELYEAIKPKP